MLQSTLYYFRCFCYCYSRCDLYSYTGTLMLLLLLLKTDCQLSNCIACHNETHCTECRGSYFVYQGKCVLQCPEGLHHDIVTKDCVKEGIRDEYHLRINFVLIDCFFPDMTYARRNVFFIHHGVSTSVSFSTNSTLEQFLTTY